MLATVGECSSLSIRRCLHPLVWIFVHLSPVLCFNVHISDIPGMVGLPVFNLSHGFNWSYSVDRLSTTASALSLLTLDSSTGVVTLRHTPSCTAFNSNPLHYRTVARAHKQDRLSSTSNYTLTSTNVFLHGHSCPPPINMNTVKSHHLGTHYIVLYSPLLKQRACIETGDSILFLRSYLPISLKQCAINVNIESRDIVFDQESWEIRANSLICSNKQEVVISVELLSQCGESDFSIVPIKIIIHENTMVNEFSPVIFQNKYMHQRLRRAITNNPPVFPETSYTRVVQEEQKPGLMVITITASDTDEGAAGTLTYSLVVRDNQQSFSMFAINPITGAINTTKQLDRETIAVHNFLVFATDGGRPQKSSYTQLRITVQDVNDHTPEFKPNVYFQSIPENINIGYTVVSLRATDGDFGENADIRYSIVNPTGKNDVFMIDPVSGSISTKKNIDREKIATYQLLVQAMDQGQVGTRRSSTATVNINVQDENDEYPEFEKSVLSLNVSEDLDISMHPVIARVTAHDNDEGANAEIWYSITGGDPHGTFSIDPGTGEFSAREHLDHETVDQYNVNIKAEDGGMPVKARSMTIIVQVLDVNDNDPQFDISPYVDSVKESAEKGSTVLTVQAHDRDSGQNSELRYSIINPPATLPFAVEATSGRIKIKSSLDRERSEVYHFVVKAVDLGVPPRSSTTSVTIQIRDANDNKPIFSPKTYNVSVSEDAEPNRARVVTVTATDEDSVENAVITYEISSGNAGEAFELRKTMGEGVIYVNNPLNYKLLSRYILTITAKDQGGLYDSAQVYIYIVPINTEAPSFQGRPYKIQVSEDVDIGTSIYHVFALDSDIGENGRVTYGMPGTSIFEIDPNTGDIRVRQELDREAMPGYTLSVTATDNGNPPEKRKTSTDQIEVTVMDVNDNRPLFMDSEYTGKVQEDEVVGASVIQISAQDRDKGPYGQVQYTFLNGTDGNGDFEIDKISGMVRIAKPLDRERIAEYELVAYAVDQGYPAQSSSVIIKISVGDVNDNAPMFAHSIIEVEILENSPIGSTVATITAVDPDKGANAEIVYSFTGGEDADFFQLGTRPGEPAIITNKIDLDYESEKKEYEIILRAMSQPLFSETTIRIHVRDINDNPPSLKDFSIIFNNYISHFPTTPIGRIPAHDPDEIDRTRLQYRFVSGNEAQLLHLDPSSGEITLDSRLNSDVPRNGTFQVSVKDSEGKNEVKATCRLYVRLVTKEMLQNSVTIRLNNMTQTAFLSPLFKFFVDALATILHTDVASIFVISVQDDTDVPAQILNVSVSIRERIEKGNDVFYPTEYLQEQIYLERTLLANLSTLQVLPFDDNLCDVEPCPNFEVCQSKLVFASAAKTFISSDTMLFRPIYPKNGYQCSCPVGFTGKDVNYVCDIEVDLCYSSPCRNQGTCLQKEGGYTCACGSGFTGKSCEVNMTMKYDTLTCPQNICRPPSYCLPLIKNGFRCEGCPPHLHYNEFCQLTTRNFPRGSFLTFPSLKKRQRFTIQLRFATQEKDGLLFYNGRFNEQHDFIALEIIDGQVQFSFSLGSNITSVHPYIKGGVNDGEWHQVTVHFLNRTATVTVGEDCDTELSIMYGDRLDNLACAARVTYSLSEECKVETKLCHRLLDLTGPLQIGGLPTLPSTFQVTNKDFVGCMKDFMIDAELLDLNMSVANNGTAEGCRPKNPVCLSSPCQNGGTCVEGWNRYYCKCLPRTGGKDCSQGIEPPRKLQGNGYLLYTFTDAHSADSQIYFTWQNGLSFRTRNPNGALMQITVQGGGEKVLLELEDGYVKFRFEDSMSGSRAFRYNLVRVDDGQWHYFDVRWQEQGRVIMILDYDVQRQKVVTVPNGLKLKKVNTVYVGAHRNGNDPISNGFNGCIQDVRVGTTSGSLLKNPDEHNAQRNCVASDVCGNNPCPRGATCVDEWEDFSCKCPRGTFGPECKDICSNYNPCKNWATCRHPARGTEDYMCDCGNLQKGQYCEITSMQPCPAKWWGYPVCGPCNCSRDKGFNPECKSTNGTCACLENHYRPPDSSRCFPCDCYTLGSTGPRCDGVTGQCKCKEGVVGQRCDQCSSKFAEIKEGGCRVVYEACPRVYTAGVWWDHKVFGQTTIQHCPNKALGDAKRNCTADGWSDPDLFNCTSVGFEEVLNMTEDIEKGNLLINTFVAKSLVAKLSAATMTTNPMLGGDINVTFRIVSLLLDYENSQTNYMNLTSEQDRNYLKNLFTALSNVFETKYIRDWQKINAQLGGAAVLIQKLDSYLSNLTQTIALSEAWPYSVVTTNIVLGVDTISKHNFTGTHIPKHDNIVAKDMFDMKTKIKLPESVLKQSASKIFIPPSKQPKAYVGYIMYRTLGSLIQEKYASDVRVTSGRPVDVNSPIFGIILRDEGKPVEKLTTPMSITFKQAVGINRTSPQCIFWQHQPRSVGQWSTEGCEVDQRYELDGEKYVTCTCSHMTSFALLMDIANDEYVKATTVTIEVFTYIVITVSLGCLFVAFIIFMSFKHLQCNANSILINLIFVIFVAELFFVIGVDRTTPQLFCRLVAIALHYFYMSAFAWMFVEVLHLYRMLTEIRDIDHGSMKFYYLLGYVTPGIIVGLAVGLYTNGYGNDEFCWLSVKEVFIWSFAGPIGLAVVIIIITFALAVKASCREKIHVTDMRAMKRRMLGAIILLLLLGLTWVLGLLSVNTGLKSLHYLFAFFSCLQGVFIFTLHVVFDPRVRYQLKKLWYKCQGKKLEKDENLAGTRSSMMSGHRSALAYRHDSSIDGGLNRINVGISTTSTTSRSTSKSSGGLYKGEDYLRSTSTSTSGNVPTGIKYPKHSAIPPYGYEPPDYTEKAKDGMCIDNPDTGEVNPKNNSDSDSEISDNDDLDLASSHSSDEDDDVDLNWENTMPKNEIVEKAKEQARLKKKQKEDAEKQNTVPYISQHPGQWPGDPNLGLPGSDSDYRHSEHTTLSSTQPDVTLSAQEVQGPRDYIIPPVRTDSLLNHSGSSNDRVSYAVPSGRHSSSSNDRGPYAVPSGRHSSSSNDRGPYAVPSGRMKVQVLTHNGSISSDSSECSHETSV